jgi:hypothetical protein
MNIVNGAGPPGPHFVKKLEPTEDRGGGKDIKPVRTTLNRVPRSSDVVSALDIFTDFKPCLFTRCLREFPGTSVYSVHPSDPFNLHRMPAESKKCVARAPRTPLVSDVGNNRSSVFSRNQIVKLL